MKPTKKTLFYTTYIIGITVLFLYYLFPSDAVKDYVAYKMSLGSPDISVTIDHVSPVLPPGINLHDVGIAHGDKVLIDLDSVKITPGWLSVFSSTKTTNFKGRLNAGTVDGTTQVDSSSEQGAEKIEGTISGVQVQGIPALQGLTAHKISGSLGGDFIIAGTWPDRTMTGQLTLSDSRINFDQPVVGLPSLEFIKIDADLALSKDNLAIKKLSARGNQLDADISGTIALNEGGRQNALDLNGSISPHHGFLAKMKNSIPASFLLQKTAGNKAISFTIGGTVEAPAFRLN